MAPCPAGIQGPGAAWGSGRAGALLGGHCWEGTAASAPLTPSLGTGKPGRARGHEAAHSSVPAEFVLENICWEKKGFFEGKHPSSLGKALSLQNTN